MGRVGQQQRGKSEMEGERLREGGPGRGVTDILFSLGAAVSYIRGSWRFLISFEFCFSEQALCDPDTNVVILKRGVNISHK